MIKRVLIPLCFCLMVVFTYADDEEKKRKSGDENQSKAHRDSTLKGGGTLDKQSEDTLVFEDWDGNLHLTNGDAMAKSNGQVPTSKSKKTDYSAQTGDHVSMHGEQKEFEFDVYPNPVANTLFIRGAETAIQLRVINMSGAVLVEQSSNQQVDVSSLEAGIYFIQLVYADQVETKKFIKRS